MRHECAVGDESDHPITSPKGGAVVTLLLAALGVFTPFFASLALALAFAAVVVGVIAWIYWSDFVAVFERRTSAIKVLLPSFSGLSVIVMAVLAILSAQPPSIQKPSLTVDDIERVVSKAMIREPEEKPNIPPTVQRERLTVIEVPTVLSAPEPRAITDQKPKRPNSDDSALENVRRQSARMKAGREEYYSCLQTFVQIGRRISQLNFEATVIQNRYADGRDEKKMVGGLGEWTKKVDVFFKETPQVVYYQKAFNLANQGEGVRTFLGIGQNGYRSWASIDAKRKSLEVLAEDVAKDETCEANRGKAVQKCLDDKTC
jgi:hypothetical protein